MKFEGKPLFNNTQPVNVTRGPTSGTELSGVVASTVILVEFHSTVKSEWICIRIGGVLKKQLIYLVVLNGIYHTN